MIFEVPSVSIVSPTSAVLPRRDDDGGDVAFCKNCINVCLVCDASSDYFQVGVSERFCHSLGTAAALRLGHLARRASQGNDPLSTLERLISDLCTSQTTRPKTATFMSSARAAERARVAERSPGAACNGAKAAALAASKLAMNTRMFPYTATSPKT